jgi:putative CocE/NonD family hydrolase
MTTTLSVPGGQQALSTLVKLDDPGIAVLENVWIPMPDGARLAARIFLPAAAYTTPAGAVLEYLPYRKRDAYRHRDDVAGPLLAKGGIALVRVDIRGTGDSDGVMIDEYMPIEQADAVDVIDWIAHQPWCNGCVGMRGISYGSFVGLQAAEKAPPALKAIVSTCGTELRYPDDIHYRGGCLIADNFVWGMQFQVIMAGPPDPAIVGAERWRALWRQRLEAAVPLAMHWTEHQALDSQWQNGSVQDYAAIRCAIYNVGGTLDSYLPSVTRMLERAPQVPQKALIGPWAHKWPGYPQAADHIGTPPLGADGVPGPGVDWMPLEVTWWRHWLLGEANGAMHGQRVWAYREDRPAGACYPHDAAGGWVSETQWPSPTITARSYFLNGDGLAERAGPEQLLVHRTNLTIGYANSSLSPSAEPSSWWRDQSRDDALSLVFDSAPLADALDVMGEPVFHVRVRSDRPVAKLCARLSEVTPDGQSHFLCYGLLNLTHRESDAAPTALIPGEDVDVRIRGHFACHRFAPGSRIRVALSETWWPVVWPSPELVTLHVTAGASRVELPVRPTQADEDPPFGIFRNRYAVPGAEPGPYLDPLANVEITGEPGNRTFTLIGGGGSMEPGSKRIPDIDTTLGGVFHLRRSIRENDPCSAEIETEAVNFYERGDWQVRLRARCLCRCTPSHFLCSEVFEASDGERIVFSRTWEKAIPRQLV